MNNASPIDYPFSLMSEFNLNLECLTLNQNAGHAQNLLNNNTICGWHAAVILSLTKFLISEYDLYVYVEQDVVLENLTVEDFYTNNIKLGRSLTLSQPIQQSLFAVNKSYAQKFLSRLLALKADDYQLSCERKFAIAASTVYRLIPSFIFHPFHKCKALPCRVVNILQSLVLRLLLNKDFINVPGGRDRDNLGEKYYLQQLTADEMYRYYHEHL